MTELTDTVYDDVIWMIAMLSRDARQDARQLLLRRIYKATHRNADYVGTGNIRLSEVFLTPVHYGQVFDQSVPGWWRSVPVDWEHSNQTKWQTHRACKLYSTGPELVIADMTQDYLVASYIHNRVNGLRPHLLAGTVTASGVGMGDIPQSPTMACLRQHDVNEMLASRSWSPQALARRYEYCLQECNRYEDYDENAIVARILAPIEL